MDFESALGNENSEGAQSDFVVPLGYKFGAVALRAHVQRRYEYGADLPAGGRTVVSWPPKPKYFQRVLDNLFICSSQPFQLGIWKQWRTEHDVEDHEKSNLVIVKILRSDNPRCLDNENEVLLSDALDFSYSMRMVGLKFYDRAIKLQGANIGEDSMIRSFGRGGILYGPWEDHIAEQQTGWKGIPPMPMNTDVIDAAAKIQRGISALKGENMYYRRLKRAIRAWVMGINQFDVRERLHQFMRTIEGLCPADTWSGKELAHRCDPLFSLANGNHSTKGEMSGLQFMYELRSKIEHMSDLDVVIPNYDEAVPNHQLMELSMKAELIACEALRRVLSSAPLLNLYREDSTISQLFRDNQSVLRELWGEKYDVERTILERRGMDMEEND